MCGSEISDEVDDTTGTSPHVVNFPCYNLLRVNRECQWTAKGRTGTRDNQVTPNQKNIAHDILEHAVSKETASNSALQ